MRELHRFLGRMGWALRAHLVTKFPRVTRVGSPTRAERGKRAHWHTRGGLMGSTWGPNFPLVDRRDVDAAGVHELRDQT